MSLAENINFWAGQSALGLQVAQSLALLWPGSFPGKRILIPALSVGIATLGMLGMMSMLALGYRSNVNLACCATMTAWHAWVAWKLWPRDDDPTKKFRKKAKDAVRSVAGRLKVVPAITAPAS